MRLSTVVCNWVKLCILNTQAELFTFQSNESRRDINWRVWKHAALEICSLFSTTENGLHIISHKNRAEGYLSSDYFQNSYARHISSIFTDLFFFFLIYLLTQIRSKNVISHKTLIYLFKTSSFVLCFMFSYSFICIYTMNNALLPANPRLLGTINIKYVESVEWIVLSLSVNVVVSMCGCGHICICVRILCANDKSKYSPPPPPPSLCFMERAPYHKTLIENVWSGHSSHTHSFKYNKFLYSTYLIHTNLFANNIHTTMHTPKRVYLLLCNIAHKYIFGHMAQLNWCQIVVLFHPFNCIK